MMISSTALSMIAVSASKTFLKHTPTSTHSVPHSMSLSNLAPLGPKTTNAIQAVCRVFRHIYANPLAPLDPETTNAIQAVCRVFGYIHSNPRWSARLRPDEVDLINFIVMNYSEPGRTSISNSGVSISTIRNFALNTSSQFPFPKTWRTHRGRGHKAAKYILIDAKRIFMTDAFDDWKKQVCKTSILDLPNELLQRIAALLPAKFLAILCQLNRRLYNVIGRELWRNPDMALKALEWSLNHCLLAMFEKAVEALSRVPKRMGKESTWKLFPRMEMDNRTMFPGTEKIGIHIQNRYCLSEQAENVSNDHFSLEYGTDPCIHISDETSPLHVAVSLCSSMGKSLIVRELIKHGANANAVGLYGEAPLHVAIRASQGNRCPDSRCPSSQPSYKDTFNVLLQAPDIDINLRDENGRTPLSIAAGITGSRSAWFVKELLKNPNVDINSQDVLGKSVLYHSVEGGNTKVAKLLLSRSHVDPNGNTAYLPLFSAVSNRQEAIVRSLLNKKATDPNRKDNNGRLALTLPTSKIIIKLLVQAGAELDMQDSTGLTPRETIFQAGIDLEVMRPSKRRRRK
jgi:ankyrin repeat protein